MVVGGLRGIMPLLAGVCCVVWLLKYPPRLQNDIVVDAVDFTGRPVAYRVQVSLLLDGQSGFGVVGGVRKQLQVERAGPLVRHGSGCGCSKPIEGKLEGSASDLKYHRKDLADKINLCIGRGMFASSPAPIPPHHGSWSLASDWPRGGEGPCGLTN